MGGSAVSADNGQFAGTGAGVNGGSGKDNSHDGEPERIHVTEDPSVPIRTFDLLCLAGLI